MERKYGEALKRLEEIEKLVTADDTDIDRLAALTKEARELLTFCKERLRRIEKDVEEASRGDENG